MAPIEPSANSAYSAPNQTHQGLTVNKHAIGIPVCLLLASCATPPRQAPAESIPPASVASYYDSLINSQPQRLAELDLFLNQMPKGGDLHHHYSGSLYAETYLDWVEKARYCIYADDDAASGAQKFKIETGLTASDAAPQAKSTSSQTKSAAPRARCLSAPQIKADNRLYRELLTTWSDKDYANHFHLQSPPDKQFFDTFSYFGDISDYDFSTGLQILKSRAKQENVQYIETMLKSSPSVPCPAEIAAALAALTETSSDEQIDAVLTRYFNFLQQNQSMQQSIKDYVQKLEGLAANINDDQFTLRFQAYVSRNSKPDKIFAGLYSGFAAEQASPLIVGINFVSPENGAVAMRDYHLHMRMFHFLKQRFPDSQIALHAGELALGMVPPEGLTFHIDEAVRLAGAKRIGHGVDIAHEKNAPALLELMRKQAVAVEINLSSNAFILGVENEAHPLPLYQRYHVPYVISTDDSGVSRSNLSHEYLLFASRYKPSYPELKSTVYNSIRYSFLSEQDKNKQLQQLDQRFNRFEQQYASAP
ncbi:MAG TPA: hypothetical protein VFM46_12940 [Pseudomonadales bacterium]|nr:hypothetical protein [Pseudomonadales bacterium]